MSTHVGRGVAATVVVWMCGTLISCTGSVDTPSGTPRGGSGSGGGTAGSSSGSVSGSGGSGIRPGSGGVGNPSVAPGGSGTAGSSTGPGLACASSSPRPVSLRRLNREELNNTVRDVFGIDSNPFSAIPENVDGMEGGFRTVGDKLSYGSAFTDAELDVALDVADQIVTAKRVVPSCTVASEACGREIFTPYVQRLFRRTPLPEDLSGIVGAMVKMAAKPGRNFDAALKAGFATLLASPHFLFVGADGGLPGTRPVAQPELATKMALSLWSSVPDPELAAAGIKGELATDAQILGQVDRMLADPKGNRFIDGFGKDWLAYQHANPGSIEATRFGVKAELWPGVVEAMVEETRLFVESIYAQDLHVNNFLNARFSYVNPTLAAHYGVSVTGPGFGKVVFGASPSEQRYGLLTQGSILVSTSMADHASIVRRGKRVLVDYLCVPPQNPPAALEAAVGAQAGATNLTEKQKMDMRAANSACAGCHALMDPIGFGLQNFDPVGRFTTTDTDGTPLNITGKVGADTFNSPGQLAEILVAGGKLPGCVAQHMLIQAVGRAFENNRAEDACAINDVVGRTPNPTMKGLMKSVLTSAAFRNKTVAP